MKVHTRRFLTIIILGLFVFVMTSEVCNAQYSRSGKSEIFGMIQMVDSTSIDFDPISFEMDSTTIYGFGIGMNATDHWNVNMDLLFGSADTELKLPGYSGIPISEDTDYWLWDINVDYNFLTDRLTPLVTGGIGLANMSNDALGTDESNFSYNVGAGGRWDITDNILIKLIYRITWTQIEDADNKQDFSGVALSVGYMF